MHGLNDALHAVSQALLVPAMGVLLLLLVAIVILVGSLIVEAFTERRHFRTHIPHDINAINAASFDSVGDVIEGTSLLRTQKDALLMVAGNMGLPGEDLYALAKAELNRIDDSRQRSVHTTEFITKAGPMMGLICTLIPLGPGIVAMGQGQVDQLAQSLLVAFDGTVTGLVVAVIAMAITAIRKRWYHQYFVAMEALMNVILDKAEQARAAGVRMPCGSASAEHAATSVSRKRNEK